MTFLRHILLLSLLSNNNIWINYNLDLHSPVNIPLEIAGNFGELRPNHFHTGIDIRTGGKEGLPIYAIEAGYISRIKVGTMGYGKVVYIDHPHLGITSVYAHCQNFYGLIAEYSLSKQKELEFFEFDINLPKNAIVVKKGEQIAVSGNTGTSSGPHLHFEIRETNTEHPLNPLLFKSLNIADFNPPIIHTLVLYSLSKYGYRIPDKRLEFPVKMNNGRYLLAKDTIDVPAHFCSEQGGIGLSLGVYDKNSASDHNCGIFEGVLTLNGEIVHRQIMNRLDFEINRQINTHKDYEAYKVNKSKIEKYYRTEHNKLPIYDEKYGNGILGLLPDHLYYLQFEVSDIAKNSSILSFVIRVLIGDLRLENTPFDQYHPGFLYPDSAYVLKDKNYQIHIPKNSLYEPIQRRLDYKDGQLNFGNAKEPLNYAVVYKLLFQPTEKIPAEKTVLFHHQTKSYYHGTIENEWFVSNVKTFGTFSLTFDTIAPQITRKFKISKTPQVLNRIAWNVKDDKSGLAYYALFVDDKYHLLEYEHKNAELFAQLNLDSGAHDIRIVVKDVVGNIRDESFSVNVK